LIDEIAHLVRSPLLPETYNLYASLQQIRLRCVDDEERAIAKPGFLECNRHLQYIPNRFVKIGVLGDQGLQPPVVKSEKTDGRSNRDLE